MRTIGTALCLLPLVPLGGWLLTPAPPRPSSGPDGLAAMLRQAAAIRREGDYDRAAALFAAGRVEARRRGQSALEARFLWGAANCHFSQRRYREALDEFLAARGAFARLGDSASLSALNGSLASLYSELGELDAALDAVQRARAGDSAPDPNGRRARLLILHATLLAALGRMEEAVELFGDGIREAGRYDDPELLANGFDRLGSELLLRGRLSEAEPPLLEAFRIRKLHKLPSLAGSYRHAGLLRMEQGDLRSAGALLDASVDESKSGRGRIPEWRFHHARGRLRLASGRLDAAYRDFTLALELARNYRLAAPPADAARVAVEGQLAEVHADFARTAARLYFRTGAAAFARAAFDAVEENRAASLAARAAERSEFRRAAPPEYWDAVAKLRSAEAAALADSGDAPRREMSRLRGEILEIESRSGGAATPDSRNMLDRVQRRLDPDSALLTFHLGEESSLLWAVTPSAVELYRLAGRPAIEAQVRSLRQALLARDSSARRAGQQLYSVLFGGLAAQFSAKPRWLLSLDGVLFEAPVAALADSSRYLIERRAFRIVSGAAIWLGGAGRPRLEGGFAGVGDPVYNAADPRWPGPAAAPALALARLPGSGEEIESCARAWGSELALLTGNGVTVASVRRAAESRPAVLHFATHVLRDTARGEPFIALGVAADGRAATLGAAEIAAWNVDSTLVVMSGCSPALAAARPGAGLMGLTRAWLMAGASAVAASTFPAPDDSGALFAAFYRELRRPAGPAVALRAAQVALLRGAGWRSHPAYWGGYFVSGNY